MRNLTIIFLYLFMLVYTKGYSTLDLDYSGTRLINNNRGRICDDSIAKALNLKNVYSVSDICTYLDTSSSAAKVRSLNLSNNMISDEGATILGNRFACPSFLPALEQLDLSFNRISENSIGSFSNLLLRPNFKYLIIYGNTGAASQDGIGRLVQTLQVDSIKDITPCLAKVIWVPQNFIEKGQESGFLPPYYADIHRQFYGH